MKKKEHFVSFHENQQQTTNNEKLFIFQIKSKRTKDTLHTHHNFIFYVAVSKQRHFISRYKTFDLQLHCIFEHMCVGIIIK